MKKARQNPPPTPRDPKANLLNAALQTIRAQGYCATTVDDICHQAGVTKGSFFHHFSSKDALALAAINYWDTTTAALFASAPYHRLPEPVDRLLGYLDFRAALLTGELADYTCLLGTLVQETYATHPGLRAACNRALSAHIAELTRDVQAAKDRHAPSASWTAASVGNFIQSVLQGSFIFAKAQQGPAIIHENLDHLRGYLRALLLQPAQPALVPSLDAQEADAEEETTDSRTSYFVD